MSLSRVSVALVTLVSEILGGIERTWGLSSGGIISLQWRGV